MRRNIKAVMIHGTGLDLVPLKAATERGIPVANIPGGNAQSVAEYCVLAMLMLGRNAFEITTKMQDPALGRDAGPGRQGA